MKLIFLIPLVKHIYFSSNGYIGAIIKDSTEQSLKRLWVVSLPEIKASDFYYFPSSENKVHFLCLNLSFLTPQSTEDILMLIGDNKQHVDLEKLVNLLEFVNTYPKRKWIETSYDLLKVTMGGGNKHYFKIEFNSCNFSSYLIQEKESQLYPSFSLLSELDWTENSVLWNDPFFGVYIVNFNEGVFVVVNGETDIVFKIDSLGFSKNGKVGVFDKEYIDTVLKKIVDGTSKDDYITLKLAIIVVILCIAIISGFCIYIHNKRCNYK